MATFGRQNSWADSDDEDDDNTQLEVPTSSRFDEAAIEQAKPTPIVPREKAADRPRDQRPQQRFGGGGGGGDGGGGMRRMGRDGPRGSRGGPPRPRDNSLPEAPPFRCVFEPLADEIEMADIEELLKAEGCVTKDMHLSTRSGRKCFAEFEDKETLAKVLALEGREVKGCKLVVNVARGFYGRGGGRGRSGASQRDEGRGFGRDRQRGGEFRGRRDGGGEGGGARGAAPAERPRLKLLPRTKPVADATAAPAPASSSIFGGAKPRDETKYKEREGGSNGARRSGGGKGKSAGGRGSGGGKGGPAKGRERKGGGQGQAKEQTQAPQEQAPSDQQQPKPAAAPAPREKEAKNEAKMTNNFAALQLSDDED